MRTRTGQGGSKHDGIASVLRARHPSSTSTSASSDDDLEAARQRRRRRRTPGGGGGGGGEEEVEEEEEDAMDVVARRTVPSGTTSSEIAAISLGMKRAMRAVPPHLRTTVLILSDSESALDFYCGGMGRSGGGSGKTATASGGGGHDDDDDDDDKRRRGRTRTRTERLREDAHRRCLLSLTSETPNGVLFSRVRSSSRGVVGIAAGGGGGGGTTTPRDGGIGFIDHDVADHLSSAARSLPNAADDYDGAGGGGGGGVEPLGPEDIAWLANSDFVVGGGGGGGGGVVRSTTASSSSSSSAGGSDDADGPPSPSDGGSGGGGASFWRTIEVVGSDMRCDRRERNRRRVEIVERLLSRLVGRRENAGEGDLSRK